MCAPARGVSLKMDRRRWLRRFLILVLMASLCSCKENSRSHTSAAHRPTAKRVGTPKNFTKPVLVFGLTPSISPKLLNSVYHSLARHLGLQLGIPVKLRVARTYGELTQWIIRGTVDFARLPAYSYVVTRRKYPQLRLLARELSDGSEYYHSYIIVRRASGIRRLEDLKGRRFGFVDKQSASGFLYPMQMLLARKIDPPRFFGSISYLGNHINAIRAVLEKRVDAAAIYSTAMITARSIGLDITPLVIIAKSTQIPYDAYCVSHRVPLAMANTIRSFLLSISTRTRQGSLILQNVTKLNGFVAAKHSDYASLEAAIHALESYELKQKQSMGHR